MGELSDVTIYLGLGGAAVVAALLEVVKRTLCLEDTQWMRVVPLSAIVLGIGWNALIASIGPELVPLRWNVLLFLGIFTGLASVGLYSGQSTSRGQ